ncbi:VOC family protein [Streptomyces sp. NRRL WC-3742]|uniref:VOC family protein n=1 Tax=Streptomyces sp. NRRL WC-3742 TaxID=1463934 RepID=UPI0004C6DDA1|nr:VOC family protein [Streptomyces sp. NRRL WC-3742]
MIGKLQCLVIDCSEPAALARFYAALLGGEVDRPDARWTLHPSWSTLHLDGGTVLCFQQVADHRPPRWPSAEHPQQAHLDVDVADLDEAERQVLALGAVRLHDAGGWRVYADPAGHPFCLVRG